MFTAVCSCVENTCNMCYIPKRYRIMYIVYEFGFDISDVNKLAFYSILFYSILFYSVMCSKCFNAFSHLKHIFFNKCIPVDLFYSILFYSILFYSIDLCVCLK